MVSDVGREHVQLSVGVIVADREPHPIADSWKAHLLSHRLESDRSGGGPVPIQLKEVAVRADPQIGQSIVVVVEEDGAVCGAGRVSDPVPGSVGMRRVIPLVGNSSIVGKRQRGA